MRTTDPAAARWRAIGLMAAALVVALALLAAEMGILPGDRPLRVAVLAFAPPALAAAARWVNSLGSWHAILPVMILLFALSAKARRRWWLWSAVLAGTAMVETGLKHLVARARPEDPSLGFPSGHASSVAALATVLVYLAGRARPGRARRTGLVLVAVAAAVLVGVARVVLRAHWPSDVVAGWALGIAAAAAAAWWDTTADARPAPGGARDGEPSAPRAR